MNENGWTGRDPRLRSLRTVVVIVLITLVALVVLDGRDSVTTLATLIGALLIVLGFEAGVRWPGGKDDG